MSSVCIIWGRGTRITSDHISLAKVVCALIFFLNRPMHMAQILEMWQQQVFCVLLERIGCSGLVRCKRIGLWRD